MPRPVRKVKPENALFLRPNLHQMEQSSFSVKLGFGPNKAKIGFTFLPGSWLLALGSSLFRQVRVSCLSREADGTLSRSAWAFELARLVEERNQMATCFRAHGCSRAQSSPVSYKTVADLETSQGCTRSPPTKDTLQKIFPKGDRSVWASVFLLPANLAGVELPELL